MKKILIICTAAFVLNACTSLETPTVVTKDTTVIKTDTTKVSDSSSSVKTVK